MQGEINVALLIAVTGLLASLFVAVTNYLRAKKSEDRSDAAGLTAVTADIKYIMRGIEEIKKDIKEDIKAEIKEIKEQQTDQGKTIAILQRDLKSAHHRIDELTGNKREE